MSRAAVLWPAALLGLTVSGIVYMPCPATAQDLLRAISSDRLVRSVLTSEQLPGGGPVKCGVPGLILAAARVTGESGPQLVRPSVTTETFTSPAGLFLLHYIRNGPHEVPLEDADNDSIPDYIEVAAASLDSVHQGYMALGWREPVDDLAGGPLYDVYFLKTSVYFGFDVFGVTIGDPPTAVSAPYTSASYIILDSQFLEEDFGHPPLESLRVTIAHEYHHAIQFAYSLPQFESETEPDFYDFAWFAELSATSFEDYFYDGVNDYYFYLPSFLGFPETALTDFNGLHKYGAVLWALFLEREYGPDTLLDLWSLIGTGLEPLQAHRDGLETMGSNLLEAYGLFCEWLLYTGTRADPVGHWKEGASYPPVKVGNSTQNPAQVVLPPLAARYYSESPSGAGGTVSRLVAEGREWGLGTGGQTPLGPMAGVRTVLGMATSDTTSGATVELFDWGDYSLALRWAFTGDDSDTLHTGSLEARYAASVTLPAAGSGLTLRQNYPNPFLPDRDGSTYFVIYNPRLGDVEMEIRSLSGRRVWSLTMTGLSEGQHFTGDLGVGWDGRDSSGALVPSGVYLLIVRAGDDMRGIRLSVIR